MQVSVQFNDGIHKEFTNIAGVVFYSEWITLRKADGGMWRINTSTVKYLHQPEVSV